MNNSFETDTALSAFQIDTDGSLTGQRDYTDGATCRDLSTWTCVHTYHMPLLTPSDQHQHRAIGPSAAPKQSVTMVGQISTGGTVNICPGEHKSKGGQIST